jgi:hypothetical protein
VFNVPAVAVTFSFTTTLPTAAVLKIPPAPLITRFRYVHVDSTTGVPEGALYVTLDPAKPFGALDIVSVPRNIKLPPFVKLDTVIELPFVLNIAPLLIVNVEITAGPDKLAPLVLAICTPLKARPSVVIVCATDPVNVTVLLAAVNVPEAYVQFPPTVMEEALRLSVPPLNRTLLVTAIV